MIHAIDSTLARGRHSCAACVRNFREGRVVLRWEEGYEGLIIGTEVRKAVDGRRATRLDRRTDGSFLPLAESKYFFLSTDEGVCVGNGFVCVKWPLQSGKYLSA